MHFLLVISFRFHSKLTSSSPLHNLFGKYTCTASNFEGFRRRYVTLSNTEFLDFVNCLVFRIEHKGLENAYASRQIKSFRSTCLFVSVTFLLKVFFTSSCKKLSRKKAKNFVIEVKRSKKYCIVSFPLVQWN